MADKEVKITIKAVDEFSKAFNKLDDALSKASKASEKLAGGFDDFANASGSNKLKHMANTFGEIAEGMTTIQGRAGLAVRGISTVIQNFNKLYSASKKNFAEGLQMLGKVASSIGSVIGKVAGGFVNLLQSVTGADLSFGGLASTVANFEENMTRVGVLTGANSDGLHKMTEKAQELSMKFGRSIDEVSSGMIDMASAGFNVSQILGGYDIVTAMATSGNLELARSAEILANGLNAFKMDKTREDMMRFGNTLSVVADKSATDINQLGEALTKIGPLAGMAGTDIEDVGALLGIMADNGIKASSAGTSLKNVMSRFASGNSSVTKAIKEYNLAGFEQKMLQGDLAGAMMALCDETEKYTPVQKEAIATALAGAYGMPGLVSIMNQGREGIKAYCDELERQNALEENKNRLMTLSEEVLDTTKGKMQQLTATVGVLASEIKDKLDPFINSALGGVLNFARGLMTVDQQGNVTLKTLGQLAQDSVQWGKNLSQGIQNAISSIKGFVTGGGLDNLLTIGTNVIQGICKGIGQSEGNLRTIFDQVIKKACNFITTNAGSIRDAGLKIMRSLKDAILENEGEITKALEAIMDIITSWLDGAGDLKSTMGKFADTMIDGLVEKFIDSGKNKLKEGWNAMWDFLTLEDGANIKEGSGKGGLGGKLKEWLFGEAEAGEVTEGAKKIGKNMADGTKQGYDENKQQITQSASETGTESANAINEALMSMDVGQLQALQTEMTNLGTTSATVATSMATSFTNIQDSARTSFMGLANIVRNQMLNVSNIIRNQMLNATNIVRNQATNMANAVRTSFVNMANIARNQFVNMANIARNQFVNMANIVRNQMVNCANIVRNQAKNMNDAFRTACVNMANIARNQMVAVANIVRNQMLNCTNIVRNQAANMKNALSNGMSGMASAARAQMNQVVAAVRSGMSQARSIASSTISINIRSNISRKVTTTYHVAGGLKQTMDGIASSTISVSRPNVMATEGSGASIHNIPTKGQNYAFTIPVMVDGREIARATAKYNQFELEKISKRNSRKRGE